MSKKKLAISVGDLNGIGIEIALKAHSEVKKLCHPIYCINKTMLQKASDLLGVDVDDDIELFEVDGEFEIKPSQLTLESGEYSYRSFMSAIKLCEDKIADGVVTMPIHKEAWKMAGIEYKGHTDLLRHHFKKDAIMMLGCSSMYVALFSEHIPLKDVAPLVTKDRLVVFLQDLYRSIGDKKVAVLGLNPHAGDNGVLGDEEREIESAIEYVNAKIGKEIFSGAVVPDVAFTPHFRERFRYFVAMYHDQGLAPLKALYFDESVNISLNLPIVRTSVDHGTAFDIAYMNKAKTLSYINAIKSGISFAKQR